MTWIRQSNEVGRCGICGGRVSIPTMMVNPVPSCEKCGAVPRGARGPIIEMEPPAVEAEEKEERCG